LKVHINVTVPLKKEWKVRVSTGEYVTVKFKYEKLGVFCYRCGLLGHTDKVCPELFELDADDGVRNWGPELKPTATRIGSAANNKWLQDPIPSVVPRQNPHASMFHADRTFPAGGVTSAVTFNDRMLAVDSQICALKMISLLLRTWPKRNMVLLATAPLQCNFYLLLPLVSRHLLSVQAGLWCSVSLLFRL
jgi:hypothetical protein